MKPPRTTAVRTLQMEPLTAALLVVTAVHVLLAAVVCWLWKEQHDATFRDTLVWSDPAGFRNNVTDRLLVNKPSVLQLGLVAVKEPATPAPPPAAPKATLIALPPQQSMPEPVTGTPLFAGAAKAKLPANRSITLRRARPAVAVTAPMDPTLPPMQSASLLDLVKLNALRPPAEPAKAAAPAEVELPPGLNMDSVDHAVNAAFQAAWTAPALEDVPAHQRSAALTISLARDGRVIRSRMTTPSGSHALDSSILAAASKAQKISTTLPSQFPNESYDLELNFILLP